MKSLRKVKKDLEKKRDALTAEVDSQIAEIDKKQELLQAYMDAEFGTPKSKPAQKTSKTTPSGRRQRRSRKGLSPRIVNVINEAANGIKRKGILEKLNMVTDTAGHQYVSNELGRLTSNGSIRAVGRSYFPATPSASNDEAETTAGDDVASDNSDAVTEESSSSEAGFESSASTPPEESASSDSEL
ncbi:MAG: hypothetical protein F4W90_01845 [Gammaproteobacteria bacterium]|nr:hypothetical protein [Gammaproteobacteria bacterium]